MASLYVSLRDHWKSTLKIEVDKVTGWSKSASGETHMKWVDMG
jgi:hypothetical protein